MNKIERHPQKDRIDQKILSGVSYQEISEWCKSELKFNISHMSIKRYADNAGLSASRANNSDDDQSANLLSDNEIDDALTLEIPQLKNKNEIRKFTHEKIIEGYALQIAIITQKQRLYMQGKGKYPNTEIAGLKTFLDALGFISDAKDSIFNSNRK